MLSTRFVTLILGDDHLSTFAKIVGSNLYMEQGMYACAEQLELAHMTIPCFGAGVL